MRESIERVGTELWERAFDHPLVGSILLGVLGIPIGIGFAAVISSPAPWWMNAVVGWMWAWLAAFFHFTNS